MTRLLTIMGSGETAPTMVKAHRSVVESLGPPPVKGVLLDTPFGFQTNAGDIARRAAAYFHDSVGSDLEIAGMRRAEDLSGPGGAAVVARIAAADFVFAGPGSPSYALRQWRDTLVPSLLAEKLVHGGALTFASAAALTLGAVTVPVYEIYKVGEDPRWLPGIDILGPLGLPVALIPHYDNAEGGTHDTSYCYLGEERLAFLEKSLPDGTFVLGVDEHTALQINFEAATATVSGRGGVTVRVQGRSARIEAGEVVRLAQLTEMSLELESATPPAKTRVAPEEGPARATAPTPGASPLLEAIRRIEGEFRAATAARHPKSMVAAALALEDEMWAWRADTLQSDEAERGRAALRAMVMAIGDMAESGAHDPAELVGPFVELALELRDLARSSQRFEDADLVRNRLAALGVKVRDSAGSSTWTLSTSDDGRTRP